MAGVGQGLLRTMYFIWFIERIFITKTKLSLKRHCDKNINANIVPADMTWNALIVSAFDVATKRAQMTVEKTWEIPIYNYVSSVQNPLTWGKFTDLNIAHGFDFPFSSAIWWDLKLFRYDLLIYICIRYVCFFMHKSFYMNKLFTIFLHIIPALIIDFLIVCCARKPK